MCRASAPKVVLEKSEMFCTVFLYISGDCREISLRAQSYDERPTTDESAFEWAQQWVAGRTKILE